MSLEISLKLQYSDFFLDVALSLPNRGFIGLFGHSGSGKTSLLRCIAGLERGAGRITLDGTVWQDKQTFVPTHQRPLGYVFQEASLFPHLSAMGNLEYARKRADQSASGISLEQAIELLNIGELLKRRPRQLSGGERQRVAIARTLLINPRLLLMDEPLASLDFTHKQEILPYLEKVHKELQIPVIYVSHSADEIARLADYLVVLKQGRVIASGTLQETLVRLDAPIQLGEDTGVVLDIEIISRDEAGHLVRAAFNGGELWLRDAGQSIGEKGRIRVLARDVSLALNEHTDTSILNVLPVQVDNLIVDQETGDVLVKLISQGANLLARVTLRSAKQLDLKPGMNLWAQIKSVAVIT